MGEPHTNEGLRAVGRARQTLASVRLRGGIRPMATIGEDDESVTEIVEVETRLGDRFNKAPSEDQRHMAERINRELIAVADRFRMAAEKRS